MNTVASSFSPEVAPSVLTDAYSLDLLSCFNQALTSTQNWLRQFSLYTDLGDRLSVAFGNNFDTNELASLVQDWRTGTFNTLPTIELRSASEINGAYGAFASATNTIYLSTEFLATQSPDRVASVLLEEVGHAIDARINRVDSLGDEGAIFSALVQGFQLDEPILQPLQSEDDSVVLTLDGQTVVIEQATSSINPAFNLIGLTALRNDPAFQGIDGSGIGVAVIDTGIDAAHSLLSGNVVWVQDFLRSQNHPQVNQDENSHGTHVAGTIGSIDPTIGVATDVSLIGLKVGGLDGSPSVDVTAVERALQWVLQNRQRYNIQVVNMSLGGGFYSSPNDPRLAGHPYLDDVQAVIQAGITVVATTGNFYDQNLQPGSGAPGVFSTLNVGAVYDENEGRFGGIDLFGNFVGDYSTAGDRLVYYSHRLNTSNVVFAPGAVIYSTIPGNRMGDKDGTSMAAPHVTGVVALMQEAAFNAGGRYLTPTEVRDIIISTGDRVFDGDDEDTTVPKTQIDYPRINVYRAIQAVQNLFAGGSGNNIDPNGSLSNPFIISQALDGSEVLLFGETIGIDGGSTSQGGINVGGQDVDLFRFEMAVPAELTIETSLLPGTAPVDTILRLFDQNGTPLAINDDKSSGDTFSKITINLQPGVYFAGVSGYQNDAYNPAMAGSGISGETGNYLLSLALTGGDPNGLLNGAVRLNVTQEPDLQFGIIGSDNASFNPNTGVVEGGFQVGGADVDLFEVVIPDTGKIFIDIDTPSNFAQFYPGLTYLDSLLRVFDENGNPLAFSDDDLAPDEITIGNGETRDADDNLGHTTDSYIFGDVERGQKLFIGVSDWLNSAYNLNNLNNRDASTGGYYQLSVRFQSNDLNGAIPQATGSWEIPVDQGTQFRQGKIGIDGDLANEVGDRDVDFNLIRSAVGGILEVDIDSTSINPNAQIFQNFPNLLNQVQQDPVDAVVQLWDADGNLLATVDDVDQLDPLLQYPIQPNVDYYISTSGYGNDSFNPFVLGSGTSGDTGWYGLTVRLREPEAALLINNNRIGNGGIQLIQVGESVTDNIGFDDGFFTGATDIDLYELTLQQAQTIQIQTTSAGSFSADTFLRLFDSNGIEIAFNDNASNRTSDSLIQTTLSAGRYFIGVNGFSAQARNYNPFSEVGASSGSQGSYTLTLSKVLSVPPPPPSPLTLIGTPGNDVLIGGTTDDFLVGGNGQDTLTGGQGADRFIFSGANAGGALRTSTFRSRDRITDFNFFEGDRFQLDFDNNLVTPDLPRRLFNAGRVRARNLRQAIETVYDDPNGRRQGDRDLGRDEAALFQFRQQTFLVVNDRNPNYSVRNDLVVDVTGIQYGPGDRSPGNLVVTEYFG